MITEAQEQRERLEDARLLVLKMEEEAMSQGMQPVSRSWKGKETDFQLEHLERMQS